MSLIGILLSEKLIILIKLSKNYVNPEYEIYVDPELNYTIRAYSYLLSPTFCLYTNYEKSCFAIAYKRHCEIKFM